MNGAAPAPPTAVAAAPSQPAAKDVFEKITDAAALARAIRELDQRKRPWYSVRSPTPVIAAVVAIVLGYLQIRAEDMKMSIAKEEHDWALAREARARRESYLQSIMKANTHGERLFVIEAIRASVEGEELKWADGIKQGLEAIARADETKLEATETKANEGEAAIATLARRRDAEKDPGKRAQLNEDLRTQAKNVAKEESEIRSLKRRVAGTQSAFRPYYKVCAGSGAQMCERTLTEL
jgi:hypothetical protein